MYGGKHKTAAWRQDLNIAADIVFDLLGRSAIENLPGVATAALKDEALPKFSFMPARLHIFCIYLYRIDDFKPGFDQIRQQFVDRTA
jgi:hypothetical protein